MTTPHLDIERLIEAASADELRMAMIDIHSALEDTLRWYLNAEHEAQGVLDKSETGFPMVVNLLREHTGDRLIDGERAEELIRFNTLRNRVTHEQWTPGRDEVKRFGQCASTVMMRLLSEQVDKSDKISHPNGFATPQPVVPQVFEPPQSRSYLGIASIAFIAFSFLYVLLPDLLPFNPVDDIVIGGSCLFVGLILAIGAVIQKLRK
jgi:hypothetical protein